MDLPYLIQLLQDGDFVSQSIMPNLGILRKDIIDFVADASENKYEDMVTALQTAGLSDV